MSGSMESLQWGPDSSQEFLLELHNSILVQRFNLKCLFVCICAIYIAQYLPFSYKSLVYLYTIEVKYVANFARILAVHLIVIK